MRKITLLKKIVTRKIVAAVGIFMLAGTAIVGVTGAAPAQAADWNAVAQGESSGNWAANTGNGFYGGLQFTQSSWQAAGGSQFAPRADLATKDQQITAAEHLLAMQGPGAWPNTFVGGASTSATSPAPVQGHSVHVPDPKPSSPNVDPVPPTVPHAREAASVDGTTIYTVKQGDTLSSIAASHHTTWQRIRDLNNLSNPDLIHPGDILHIG